jgi:hypothetical protein
MVELYNKAPASLDDQLVEDLGDWIDQYNLATMITDAIRQQYGTVTLQMAKDLWYRALEYYLPHVFEEIANWLPNPVSDDE